MRVTLFDDTVEYNMAATTATQEIKTYLPPDYFAVKLDDPITFRFYKWDTASNEMKCCKTTPGEIVFEEDIERRIIKFTNTHRVNTTRLGFVHFANGKKYSVYKFEYDPRLHLKKRMNEFMLPSDKFNYTLIKQKMEALGQWPISLGTWLTTAASAVFLQQQAQQAQQTQQNNTIVKRPDLPPSYVCDLLIADAITKNETCPIIYEPLTKENAVVTSCFHVFSRAAFLEWKKKSAECPTCRTVCSVTA